jgi:hypothetical protein
MLVKLACPGHPLGNSSQYIPVGQGFFIIGRPSSTNPKIIFKNSQDCLLKKIR